jgi:hypothetical protein
MRVNDVKSILWWLSGGLLICVGVLGAVVFFLKPTRSHARAYGLYGERQLARAREPDRDRPAAGLELETAYGSTFEVEIDGVRRFRPGKKQDPIEDPPAPRDFKLADLIDVVGVWTDAVFYRVKSDAARVEEVEVGEAIPAGHVPRLEGKAELVRIEYEGTPFRAVFDVNGEEQAFRIPRDQVGETVVIGRDVVSDAPKLFEDVAWKAAPGSGIVVLKIRPGSRADLLNADLGGLLEERDVIVSVGGLRVRSKAQLINHFKQNPVPPGAKLKLVIFRHGKTITRTIFLAGD